MALVVGRVGHGQADDDHGRQNRAMFVRLYLHIHTHHTFVADIALAKEAQAAGEVRGQFSYIR